MNAALPRKKLPIGIQTFAEIREDACYYVDKTPDWVYLENEFKVNGAQVAVA